MSSAASSSTRDLRPWNRLLAFSDQYFPAAATASRAGADPLLTPDNTYLHGNWEKLDYFQAAAAQIRHDFTFRPEIVKEQAAVRHAIQESPVPTVSLHVLRSGTLEPEYYSRALDALGYGVGSLRLFAFTDDPDWYTTHLRLNQQDLIVGAARALRCNS